jgi:hypothetical protein
MIIVYSIQYDTNKSVLIEAMLALCGIAVYGYYTTLLKLKIGVVVN